MSGQVRQLAVVERCAYGADGEPVAYTNIWGLTSNERCERRQLQLDDPVRRDALA